MRRISIKQARRKSSQRRGGPRRRCELRDDDLIGASLPEELLDLDEALAKVAAEAGLITNPPHEIPFLRGYFEKAVSLIAMQNQGRLRIPVPPRADAPAP